jgi:hydroxymethylpyrimidine kinase / phosphomethylpyrimidine kinase / thiamine-phosphate diphosphorylase
MISFPPLYYITQPLLDLSYTKQVETVCAAGVKILQLRVKDCNYNEFLSLAREIKQITDKYGVILIINDNPEIANLIDAHGVHLGINDMSPAEARKILGKGKIIGGTSNTFKRVLEISSDVDYLGIGPFRFTQTKKNLSPVLGIEGYRNILKQMKDSGINIPVYAIGGIVRNDFSLLMETGIHGIAVSSVIANSSDITETTKELIKELNKYYV